MGIDEKSPVPPLSLQKGSKTTSPDLLHFVARVKLLKIAIFYLFW